MGFTLGKRTQIDNMSYPAPGVDNSVPGTPGKQTLTGQLAAQVKAQEHQLCDDGGDGCFLDPITRQRLDGDIEKNILAASQNWGSALTNKRIDLLTKHKEGWGTLWKIVGTVAMAGLGVGVGRAIEWLGEAAEGVRAAQVAARIVNHEEQVHGVFDFVGEQMIDGAKDMVNDQANEQANEQAAFLSKQQDAQTRWSNALGKAFPKQLDDFGRLLLLGLTDPRVMSVGAFTAHLNTLLARFEENVGVIGERAGGLRDKTAAWIYPRAGGKPRLAIVVATFLDGGLDQKDEWVADTFVRWVEEDMVPYAVDKLNAGGMAVRGPLTLDKLQAAPSDPETRSWDHYGGEATDPMWPDFSKQKRSP